MTNVFVDAVLNVLSTAIFAQKNVDECIPILKGMLEHIPGLNYNQVMFIDGWLDAIGETDDTVKQLYILNKLREVFYN